MIRRGRANGTLASWLRLGRASAVATLVVVIGGSALGLLSSDASWLGAADDHVASVAIDTYAGYLRRVAWGIAQIALVEWVVLTIVTLGLLHLVARARPTRRPVPWRAFARELTIALFVTLVLWGYGAASHPGLFLGILAVHRGAALWAEACRFLAPVVLLASFAGLLLGAARARYLVLSLFSAVVLLSSVGLVRGGRWVRRYQADAPFAIASAARPPASAGASVTLAYSPEDAVIAALVKAPRKTAEKGALPPRPSNILWIAVDSLRPDHIDPRNTPNIARLLGESIYFPNTIVPVPRTGPSWTAALTSLEPLTTGIETMFPDEKRSNLVDVALPAYLASHAYHTMVVSEYAGEFFRRVKLGFETEAVPRAELMQISGQIMLSRTPLVLAPLGLAYGSGAAGRHFLPEPLEELLRGLPNYSAPEALGDDIRAFLGRNPAGPSFILAFYSQPHFPYTSSAQYARRYHVAGSSPALAYGRDVAGEAPITTDVDRRQVDALYRAALAESDAAIGKLLGGLRASGWLDDTIVVLTADHGEGLYELPECVGHGDNLRGMMTLRVPLAIRLPPRFAAARPGVFSHHVSLLDVYPTLTELLGLPKLAINEGTALLEGTGAVLAPPTTPRTIMVETGEWLWTTAAVPKDRIDYPPVTTLAHLENDRISIDPKYEGVIRAAKHRAAIRAPYKLLYEPSRAGVAWRLFDFESDPLDARDIAAVHPEVVTELKEALRRSVLRHSRVLPVGDYFLTRPPGPPEDHW